MDLGPVGGSSSLESSSKRMREGEGKGAGEGSTQNLIMRQTGTSRHGDPKIRETLIAESRAKTSNYTPEGPDKVSSVFQ